MTECPMHGWSAQPRETSTEARQIGRVARVAGLAFGLAGFAATWAFFACLVIFVGNLWRDATPLINQVDGGGVGAPTSLAAAVTMDVALMALFGLQHSGMARARFRDWVTRIVPPALERSLYVHAACGAGFLLILLWQPIPSLIWDIEHGALRAALWTGFAAGWLLLLLAALSIDITELLGLKQAWSYYAGRPVPVLRLKTTWLYGWLRHPMYIGVLLGFWCAPTMTVGHLLLAGGMTLYVAVGMSFEERDLRVRYGAAYLAWRAMPAPGSRRRGQPAPIEAQSVRDLVAHLRKLHQPVRAPLPAAIQRRLAALGV